MSYRFFKSPMRNALLQLALIEALATPLAYAQTAATDTDQELEEVVVTGTRAALVASRDLKRDAVVVQDSIVAEDLGRFPDDNVADSLSLFAGITISRTHGGEGQFASVRGLGPQYSIVTLNNRIIATDGDGRDFAFDVLPAEVLYGADVYKSPQASQLEGSIGGAINLSSARPLAKPGMHTSVHAEGEYNDLSRKGGGKVSLFFSDTFADDTLGILLSAVRSETKIRSDAVQEFLVNPDSPHEFDANNDGVISADESDLLGLCCTTFGARTQDKKRTAVSAAFEWKPNDALHLTVDALVTRLDGTTIGNMQSYYVEDSILDESTGQHRWSNVTIRDHWVTDMTVAQLAPEISTITESRVVNTKQFGVNGAWQATDRLKLVGDAYLSKAERDSGGKDTWVVSGIAGDHTGYVHMNNNGLPDISVTLEDGRDLATALSQGALGNADYGLHYVGLSGTDVIDKVDGQSISGNFSVEFGSLKSFDFGVNRTKRSKTRDTIENDTSNGSCQYCDMYDTTFASLGANVVSSTTLPNFMRNARGHFPQSMVTFDVPAYLAALRTLDGKINPATGEPFDSHLTDPVLSPVQSYDVTENTLAAYFQANFKSEAWFGNIGLRWVRTKTNAKTAINRIVEVDDPTPELPTSNPSVTYSNAEPVDQSGSYSKLLPSLNFGYWLTPDLLLRTSASQVIARPSLNQLAPTAVDTTVDRSYVITYGGSAGLGPVKANQADLSLEWYFDKKSALTAALFWKDISGFITHVLDENVDIGVVGQIGSPATTESILYDISRPINGDKAKVLGVEIGAQYFLDNGFGFRGSYTHTDTKAYVGGVHVGQLEGVSKSAFSAAILFENKNWNMQVAADHSGRQVVLNDSVGGLSEYAAPITWVTASIAYNVTENISVSLEGKNLTDAYSLSTLGRPDILAGFETWGRTYILGVSAKF